jgi:hypothetical protein
MKVIESWDIDSNFWEANIQFKAIAAFKKLFDADKSKHKVDSSRLMWGLSYLLDFDSKFRQLSDSEKKGLIESDILKIKGFNWSTVQEQIDAWKLFQTAAQKQMLEWERFMNEKTTYLKTLKYSAETADEIEKRLLSNSKLYDEYDKIMERLSQEGEAGKVMGGGVESASEKGDI